MSEVRQVIVTIKPRKGSFPGQVTYGWYTLQDGVVTLTDRKGNPAGEETGRKFTHKLAPGEDARAIACKLTKELRQALRDNSASVAGFEGNQLSESEIHLNRGEHLQWLPRGGSVDVRFTPKSGHQLSARRSLLCAKSRHSALR